MTFADGHVKGYAASEQIPSMLFIKYVVVPMETKAAASVPTIWKINMSLEGTFM